jgi:hypothetical protein
VRSAREKQLVTSVPKREGLSLAPELPPRQEQEQEPAPVGSPPETAPVGSPPETAPVGRERERAPERIGLPEPTPATKRPEAAAESGDCY